MKKEQALLKLIEYLTEYQQKGYIFHKRYIKELKDIVLKLTGREAEIFDLLVKQLRYIAEYGRRVNEIGQNEKLKHMQMEQEYYSLYMKGTGFNLRMLMTFYEDETPLILGIFYEKGGKSVSDYSKWKPILASRYEELKEDIEYGDEA